MNSNHMYESSNEQQVLGRLLIWLLCSILSLLYLLILIWDGKPQSREMKS